MAAISVGYGNFVSVLKITAIVSATGAPMKRMISNAKDRDKAIDATQGRRTCSVIFTENNDYIILSAVSPETLVNRMKEEE